MMLAEDLCFHLAVVIKDVSADDDGPIGPNRANRQGRNEFPVFRQIGNCRDKRFGKVLKVHLFSPAIDNKTAELRRVSQESYCFPVHPFQIHDTFTCRLLLLSVGSASFIWLGAGPSSLCGATPSSARMPPSAATFVTNSRKQNPRESPSIIYFFVASLLAGFCFFALRSVFVRFS